MNEQSIRALDVGEASSRRATNPSDNSFARHSAAITNVSPHWLLVITYWLSAEGAAMNSEMI